MVDNVVDGGEGGLDAGGQHGRQQWSWSSDWLSAAATC